MVLELAVGFDGTAGVRPLHLAARVTPEHQLNKMLQQTRNKSSALFSIAAMHLDHLLRNYASQGLVIVCDRQGGREHYGHLLRLMFDEWSLEVTSETTARSEYRMWRKGVSGEKGSGAFCRNGPKGAAHKTLLTPFLPEGCCAQKVPDPFSPP